MSLAQCAFLAGINNAPNTYNPFTDTDRTEKISKRTKTVLGKMQELGYISNQEYNSAVSEVDSSLNFSSNNNIIYSYHTDALINELISDIAEYKHIPQDFATNFLYLSGSNIYSAETRNIQDRLQEEFKKSEYIITSEDKQVSSQSAMIIIDVKTRTSSCLYSVD